MCGGFPVPHSCRFRSALFSSRTVGFPESGWRRQLLSRRPFHVGERLKVSFPYALLLPTCYQRRFAARLRIHVIPALCPGVSPRCGLCPPRVPLRKHGITALAPRSRHGSAGVTPPSSLLRTHAPDRHPPVGFGCPYSSRSLQVVPSPCCTTALPDVISAILVKSSGSVPRHGSAVHSSVSSRGASASPKGQRTRPVR